MDRQMIMDHIKDETEGARIYLAEGIKLMDSDPECAADFLHMAKQELCHAEKLANML